MSEEFTDAARTVEHRLTRLEGMAERLTEQIAQGFAGVYARQDRTNGNVSNLLDWEEDHKVAHATQDGIRTGQVEVKTSVASRDKLLFATFITVITLGINVALKVWS